MSGSFSTEAVVVGAGPAGLGTALGLAHEGVKVVVLEKQDRVGTARRGETIRFNRDMDRILGQGFFGKQTIRKITQRTYFSHTGMRSVERTISNPNLIISWPDFMQAMADVVQKAGVRILTASNVLDFIRKDRRVRGVQAVVHGFSGEEISARAVFSCGGHDDPASRILCINRAAIDLPIHKKIVRGFAGPDGRLQYHFHAGADDLAVGAVFPRGNTEAEILLMGLPRNGKASRLSFEGFCEDHPLFAENLKGTETTYSLSTLIPMGGMIHPFCPRPGLVMAGDALGHVQARGGSGIRTSFLIGYAVGRLGAIAIKSGEWDQETSDIFEKIIRKSTEVRSLKIHNLIYSRLRASIFDRIRTPQEMDAKWGMLKLALR